MVLGLVACGEKCIEGIPFITRFKTASRNA